MQRCEAMPPVHPVLLCWLVVAFDGTEVSDGMTWVVPSPPILPLLLPLREKEDEREPPRPSMVLVVPAREAPVARPNESRTLSSSSFFFILRLVFVVAACGRGGGPLACVPPAVRLTTCGISFSIMEDGDSAISGSLTGATTSLCAISFSAARTSAAGIMGGAFSAGINMEGEG